MKTLIFALSLLASLSLRSQSLVNTFWTVYNPFIQTYSNYKFSATHMGFAGAGSNYVDGSKYFVSSNNFKIVETSPQSCMMSSDTGYYTFSISSDILDFIAINDPCTDRKNVLTNFTWYRAGTLGLASLVAPAGKISLSPNPANSSIWLNAASVPAGAAYTIMDLAGRVLLRGQTESGQTNIPLENLPPGLYTLQVHSGANTCIKLIKE
jgi:hypothetical protein